MGDRNLGGKETSPKRGLGLKKPGLCFLEDDVKKKKRWAVVEKGESFFGFFF